ncbi:MAG: hypothetical protein EHM13_01160 [Acidobacteria bacterium]|nr:MAG: hypothetical protein EHM13_01160 [Acidobacteriota bacterium]
MTSSAQRARFALLVLLLVAGAAVHAQAPPPGSGSFEFTGPVRVIDGDTLDVYLSGRRVGVGLIGIDAPPGNTACGQQALDALRRLTAAGLRLDEDPELVFDARHRRMYYAVSREGVSLARELVSAGVARANGRGREQSELALAEAQARQAGAGCVWGGG